MRTREPVRSSAATRSGATRVDPGAGSSQHGPLAQLLIAWSPLSAILIAYWAAQWATGSLGTPDGSATNRLGAPLHVLGPARVDAWAFGTVPSAWLQQHLAAAHPTWYDAVAAVVYATHFVSIPLVTALAWFRLRDRFREWLVAVLVMSLTGVGIYLAYPTSPPWLASQDGVISGVDRISDSGWGFLGLDVVGDLTQMGQGASNPVAAMPSLHAGAALLVALFLWRTVGSAARVALGAYAVAMALTLVYTGEHYVVDVAAGWVVAVVAIVVARPWRPAVGPGSARSHDRTGRR